MTTSIASSVLLHGILRFGTPSVSALPRAFSDADGSVISRRTSSRPFQASVAIVLPLRLTMMV